MTLSYINAVVEVNPTTSTPGHRRTHRTEPAFPKCFYLNYLATSHKSHMHQANIPRCNICNKMCTNVHFFFTKWCIVGYGPGTSWYLWDRSVVMIAIFEPGTRFNIKMSYRYRDSWYRDSYVTDKTVIFVIPLPRKTVFLSWYTLDSDSV